MKIIYIFLLSLLFARPLSPVLAEENNLQSSDEYELQQKQEIIKQTLKNNGSVDSEFVKTVMKADLLRGEVKKFNNTVVLITGRNGTVEANIPTGQYLLEIGFVKGLDLKVQESLDLEAGGAVITVAAQEGEGKVEKLKPQADLSQQSNLASQEDKEVKVSVVVFKDSNQNSKMDNGEEILPIAGIKVTLKKAFKNNEIKLSVGWNLITIPAIPQKPISASNLLGEIAKQGGYATTVSKLEDGAWKSYVKRGEIDYSGDDFTIEVGRAYFVKVLKPVAFKFSGQEFITPLKTKLTSGWNAVGLPKTNKTYKASGIIDEINAKNGASDAVSRWQLSLWDTLVKKQEQKYGKDFVLENNRGYLIRSEKEGEFEF